MAGRSVGRARVMETSGEVWGEGEGGCVEGGGEAGWLEGGMV